MLSWVWAREPGRQRPLIAPNLAAEHSRTARDRQVGRIVLKKSVEIANFSARVSPATPSRSGLGPGDRLKAAIWPFSSCCGLLHRALSA